MTSEERRLAAIVFTDICGFTELMGRDENKAMTLLEQQRALLRPIIDNFNGEWLKEIGDGVLISFPSAVMAVTCALEIQRILAHNSELTLRIGIHIGDIIKKDGDVFGDGVNIASRLEPLAEPGGICVSERVHEDIKNKPEISTAFQEEQLLKGVDKPIKVYSIFTQMGSEPSIETPPIREPQKTTTKIPFIIGGIVMGLLITVFAIRSSGSGIASIDGNSLAVFNFENLSAEDKNDRTGQILQELMITDLSGINNLKIYSSQRLFDIQKQMGEKNSRYIDPSMALDIAREAGSASMMTGNIIKVGNTVVLTSRLLDVDDGSVIQSRKVEGTDIYAMVDELTSYVIEDLNLGMIETVNLAVSEKTSSNMTAYNHYVTGVDYLNNANFNRAVLEFQEAVSMDSTFKKALYKLAIAQWWAKGVEAASSDSSTIVTLDTYLALPNLTGDEKKLAEGVKNIISEKYIDALETFEYLAEIHPDNKEYLYLLGECHFHGSINTLKALSAFERAMNLDPEFELASIHILDLYSYEKRYDKAIEMVESKLDNNPNSLILLDRLATIKFNQGFSEDGIEISEKILNIDSSNFLARFGKIRALFELNRFDESETLILDLRKESTNRFVSFMLKNGLYFIQGKFLDRREKLMKLYNEGGRDAANMQLLARAILLCDNLSENKTNLKNDVKQFSNFDVPELDRHIDFLYNMFWAYAILGDLKSCKTYQEKIQDIILDREQTGSWQGNYINLCQLISSYYQQDWVKVLSTFRQYPNTPVSRVFREFSRFEKCEAEFNLMKYDHALITAKKLVSPDQDYRTFTFSRPFGYYWQGRIHEEKGNTQEAISAYESLLELWKNGDERLPKRIDAQKRLITLKKNS